MASLATNLLKHVNDLCRKKLTQSEAQQAQQAISALLSTLCQQLVFEERGEDVGAFMQLIAALSQGSATFSCFVAFEGGHPKLAQPMLQAAWGAAWVLRQLQHHAQHLLAVYDMLYSSHAGTALAQLHRCVQFVCTGLAVLHARGDERGELVWAGQTVPCSTTRVAMGMQLVADMLHRSPARSPRLVRAVATMLCAADAVASARPQFAGSLGLAIELALPNAMRSLRDCDAATIGMLCKCMLQRWRSHVQACANDADAQAPLWAWPTTGPESSMAQAIAALATISAPAARALRVQVLWDARDLLAAPQSVAMGLAVRQLARAALRSAASDCPLALSTRLLCLVVLMAEPERYAAMASAAVWAQVLPSIAPGMQLNVNTGSTSRSLDGPTLWVSMLPLMLVRDGSAMNWAAIASPHCSVAEVQLRPLAMWCRALPDEYVAVLQLHALAVLCVACSQQYRVWPEGFAQQATAWQESAAARASAPAAGTAADMSLACIQGLLRVWRAAPGLPRCAAAEELRVKVFKLQAARAGIALAWAPDLLTACPDWCTWSNFTPLLKRSLSASLSQTGTPTSPCLLEVLLPWACSILLTPRSSEMAPTTQSDCMYAQLALRCCWVGYVQQHALRPAADTSASSSGSARRFQGELDAPTLSALEPVEAFQASVQGAVGSMSALLRRLGLLDAQAAASIGAALAADFARLQVPLMCLVLWAAVRRGVAALQSQQPQRQGNVSSAMQQARAEAGAGSSTDSAGPSGVAQLWQIARLSGLVRAHTSPACVAAVVLLQAIASAQGAEASQSQSSSTTPASALRAVMSHIAARAQVAGLAAVWAAAQGWAGGDDWMQMLQCLAAHAQADAAYSTRVQAVDLLSSAAGQLLAAVEVSSRPSDPATSQPASAGQQPTAQFTTECVAVYFADSVQRAVHNLMYSVLAEPAAARCLHAAGHALAALAFCGIPGMLDARQDHSIGALAAAHVLLALKQADPQQQLAAACLLPGVLRWASGAAWLRLAISQHYAVERVAARASEPWLLQSQAVHALLGWPGPEPSAAEGLWEDLAQALHRGGFKRYPLRVLAQSGLVGALRSAAWALSRVVERWPEKEVAMSMNTLSARLVPHAKPSGLALHILQGVLASIEQANAALIQLAGTTSHEMPLARAAAALCMPGVGHVPHQLTPAKIAYRAAPFFGVSKSLAVSGGVLDAWQPLACPGAVPALVCAHALRLWTAWRSHRPLAAARVLASLRPCSSARAIPTHVQGLLESSCLGACTAQARALASTLEQLLLQPAQLSQCARFVHAAGGQSGGLARSAGTPCAAHFHGITMPHWFASVASPVLAASMTGGRAQLGVVQHAVGVLLPDSAVHAALVSSVSSPHAFVELRNALPGPDAVPHRQLQLFLQWCKPLLASAVVALLLRGQWPRMHKGSNEWPQLVADTEPWHSILPMYGMIADQHSKSTLLRALWSDCCALFLAELGRAGSPAQVSTVLHAFAAFCCAAEAGAPEGHNVASTERDVIVDAYNSVAEVAGSALGPGSGVVSASPSSGARSVPSASTSEPAVVSPPRSALANALAPSATSAPRGTQQARTLQDTVQASGTALSECLSAQKTRCAFFTPLSVALEKELLPLLAKVNERVSHLSGASKYACLMHTARILQHILPWLASHVIEKCFDALVPMLNHMASASRPVLHTVHAQLWDAIARCLAPAFIARRIEQIAAPLLRRANAQPQLAGHYHVLFTRNVADAAAMYGVRRMLVPHEWAPVCRVGFLQLCTGLTWAQLAHVWAHAPLHLVAGDALLPQAHAIAQWRDAHATAIASGSTATLAPSPLEVIGTQSGPGTTPAHMKRANALLAALPGVFGLLLDITSRSEGAPSAADTRGMVREAVRSTQVDLGIPAAAVPQLLVLMQAAHHICSESELENKLTARAVTQAMARRLVCGLSANVHAELVLRAVFSAAERATLTDEDAKSRIGAMYWLWQQLAHGSGPAAGWPRQAMLEGFRHMASMLEARSTATLELVCKQSQQLIHDHRVLFSHMQLRPSIARDADTLLSVARGAIIQADVAMQAGPRSVDALAKLLGDMGPLDTLQYCPPEHSTQPSELSEGNAAIHVLERFVAPGLASGRDSVESQAYAYTAQQSLRWLAKLTGSSTVSAQSKSTWLSETHVPLRRARRDLHSMWRDKEVERVRQDLPSRIYAHLDSATALLIAPYWRTAYVTSTADAEIARMARALSTTNFDPFDLYGAEVEAPHRCLHEQLRASGCKSLHRTWLRQWSSWLVRLLSAQALINSKLDCTTADVSLAAQRYDLGTSRCALRVGLWRALAPSMAVNMGLLEWTLPYLLRDVLAFCAESVRALLQAELLSVFAAARTAQSSLASLHTDDAAASARCIFSVLDTLQLWKMDMILGNSPFTDILSPSGGFWVPGKGKLTAAPESSLARSLNGISPQIDCEMDTARIGIDWCMTEALPARLLAEAAAAVGLSARAAFIWEEHLREHKAGPFGSAVLSARLDASGELLRSHADAPSADMPSHSARLATGGVVYDGHVPYSHDDLQLLQLAYADLDDPDMLSGVAQLRQTRAEPAVPGAALRQTIELCVDLESQGRWSEAAALYQQALRGPAQAAPSAMAQCAVGLATSLSEQGYDDTALEWIVSYIDQGRPVSAELLACACTLAWKCGAWNQLGALLRRVDAQRSEDTAPAQPDARTMAIRGGQAHAVSSSMQLALARSMLALREVYQAELVPAHMGTWPAPHGVHVEQAPDFTAAVQQGRADAIAALTTASTGTLQQCLPTLAYLQVLNELVHAHQVALDVRDSGARSQRIAQLNLPLRSSTLAPTPAARSLLLSARRAVFGLLQCTAAQAGTWLDAARLSREYGALACAASMLTHVQTEPLLQTALRIEQSHVLAAMGDADGALQTLNIMQLPQGRSRAPRGAERDRARLEATVLLMTRVHYSLAQEARSASVREQCNDAVKLAGKNELSCFLLAKHCDALLTAAVQDVNLAVIRAQDSSSSLVMHELLDTPDMKSLLHKRDKALRLACAAYGDCVQVGTLQTVHEALPRLLSLLFDYTAARAAEMQHGKGSVVPSGARLYSAALQQDGGLESAPRVTGADAWVGANQSTTAELVELMGKLRSEMPGHLWMTSLPAIAARMAHRLPDVEKWLTHVLQSVMYTYMPQALWYLLGIAMGSKSTVRQQRMDKMISSLAEMVPDTAGMQLRVGKQLFVLLARVAAHSQNESSVQEVKVRVSFEAELIKAQLAMPTLENLAVTVPAPDSLGGQVAKPPALAMIAALAGDPMIPAEVGSSAEEVMVSTQLRRYMAAHVVDESANGFAYSPLDGGFPAKDELVCLHKIQERAIVLQSKEKPKKIVAVGSDGRLVNFCCKTERRGDLRKDARMMEYVSGINRMLANDAAARRRQLSLSTYAVTCLSESCGLLEWVNDTQGFRRAVGDTYTRKSLPEPMTLTRKILKDFESMQLSRTDASRTSRATLYRRRIVPHFPAVLSRWYAMQWKAPSEWWYARQQLARSSAGWSMAGHIIGLGDRHGENILLDTRRGRVVHVDFDCLFDKGLTLTRPEIVPFRLTSNLLDGLGLSGYAGTFARCSELVVKLLRAHGDEILSGLATFIHDPAVEWNRSEATAAGVTAASAAAAVPASQAPAAGAGAAAALPSTMHGGEAMNQDAVRMLARIGERLRGQYNIGIEWVADAQPTKSRSRARASNVGTATARPAALAAAGYAQHVIVEAVSDENLCRMYIGWMPFL